MSKAKTNREASTLTQVNGYQGTTRKRRSKDQIKEDIVTRDPTADYQSSRFSYYGELFVQNLPQWRLWTGRMMLTSDPIVNFSLNIRNAALMAAEVIVTAKNPIIQKWVQEQWDYLWTHHRGKLVSAKKWGFAPLQIEWHYKKGLLCIKGVKDFAPEDARAIETTGNKLVGQRIKGNPVYFPQALWLKFSAEFQSPYGTGCLRRSYPAWYEKWMDHGAKRLLQLRMIKDAYIGDIFWYPPNMLVEVPDGAGGTVQMSYRDLMREVGENRLSGGALTLPRAYDNNGKELTGYSPPQNVGGITHIFDWVDHCDENILRGADIPMEVVKAADTGSGYSGRSVPFLVMLSVCNTELSEIVQAVNEQVLRTAAWLNWGGEPEYEIEPKDLVESFSTNSQGPMGGEAIGGGSPPQQQQVPGEQYSEEKHEYSHLNSVRAPHTMDDSRHSNSDLRRVNRGVASYHDVEKFEKPLLAMHNKNDYSKLHSYAEKNPNKFKHLRIASLHKLWHDTDSHKHTKFGDFVKHGKVDLYHGKQEGHSEEGHDNWSIHHHIAAGFARHGVATGLRGEPTKGGTVHKAHQVPVHHIKYYSDAQGEGEVVTHHKIKGEHHSQHTESTEQYGEGSETIDPTHYGHIGQPFRVHKNASLDRAKQILANSKHGELRGIKSKDGNHWLWDAHHANHDQVAHFVGKDWHDDIIKHGERIHVKSEGHLEVTWPRFTGKSQHTETPPSYSSQELGGGVEVDSESSKEDGGMPSNGVSFQELDVSTSSYDGKHQHIFKKGKKEVGEISTINRSDGHHEVSNVLVWPDHQHQGHATHFYKHAHDIAHKEGKKLYISNDRTDDAKGLHEHFKKKGILKSDGEISFSSQHSEQYDEETEAIKKLRQFIQRGMAAKAGLALKKIASLKESPLDPQTLAGQIELEILGLKPYLVGQIALNSFHSHLEGVEQIAKELPKLSFPIPPFRGSIKEAGTDKPTPSPNSLENAPSSLPTAPKLEKALGAEVSFEPLNEALERLQSSPLAVGSDYLETAELVRNGAFAITGNLTDKAVEIVRDELSTTMREGLTKADFIDAVTQKLGESTLSESHLENILRTNQAAHISAGKQKALENPMVVDSFPYRGYSATHDARCRLEHRAMEGHGLQGTNIYRGDDPTFKTFLPPWSYNCRCNFYPVTVEQAARKNILEAVEWKKRAETMAKAAGGSWHQYISQTVPTNPEHVTPPSFKPSAGFIRDYRNEQGPTT